MRLVMIRRVVAFQMAVYRPPAVVIGLMVCIGVQMLKGRGHRAHLHGEAHKQDEGQTFHSRFDSVLQPYKGQSRHVARAATRRETAGSNHLDTLTPPLECESRHEVPTSPLVPPKRAGLGSGRGRCHET
jgi:hypothetical protein